MPSLENICVRKGSCSDPCPVFGQKQLKALTVCKYYLSISAASQVCRGLSSCIWCASELC